MIEFPHKKRILFISRFYIQGNNDGGSAYILDLLRYLKISGFEIIYILLPQVRFNRYPVYIIPLEVTELMAVEAERCFRAGNFLIGKFNIFEWLLIMIWLVYMQMPPFIKKQYRKIKKTFTYWRSKRHNTLSAQENLRKRFDLLPSEMDFILKMLNKYSPVAVMVNFASLAGVFDAIPESPRILKIIQNQDALHQRTGDFTKSGVFLGDLELGWTYEIECEALQKADVVVAIQKEETALFKNMSPNSKVVCIPKAAPIRTVSGEQIPGRCIFVGSGADQNVVGLNWFLREVWTDILRHYPEASLHVCGSVCESVSKNVSNVTLLGRVNDLSSEYGAAEVCIVPLIAGSGLKIKLMEALSYGKVVVSTSVGVQGVSDMSGKCVVVADTPNEFAHAVIKLMRDSDARKQMERHAREIASREFSPEACYQPLVEILNDYH